MELVTIVFLYWLCQPLRDGGCWCWAILLINTRFSAVTISNADCGTLFNGITVLSGRQQHPLLPSMAMARGNVDVEADSWDATKAALSAFEVVVAVIVDSWGVAILPIDPVESSFAQCWLTIHHGLMDNWAWHVSATRERNRSESVTW